MKKYLKYVLLGIMSIMVMGTLTAYAANRETNLFGSYDTYAPIMTINKEWNVKDEEVPQVIDIRVVGKANNEEVSFHSARLYSVNNYQGYLEGRMDPCYAVTTDNKTTVYPVDYTVKVSDIIDADGNYVDVSKYKLDIKSDKFVEKDCELALKNEWYKLDLVTNYKYTLVFSDKPETTQVIGKIEWKDEDASKRPQNVVVTLSNEDGVVGDVEIAAENNWEYVFKDLPVASDEGRRIPIR